MTFEYQCFLLPTAFIGNPETFPSPWIALQQAWQIPAAFMPEKTRITHADAELADT